MLILTHVASHVSIPSPVSGTWWQRLKQGVNGRCSRRAPRRVAIPCAVALESFGQRSFVQDAGIICVRPQSSRA
jgi:hypothetical protein